MPSAFKVGRITWQMFVKSPIGATDLFLPNTSGDAATGNNLKYAHGLCYVVNIV